MHTRDYWDIYFSDLRLGVLITEWTTSNELLSILIGVQGISGCIEDQESSIQLFEQDPTKWNNIYNLD